MPNNKPSSKHKTMRMKGVKNSLVWSSFRVATNQWHNLKLRFEGSTITGLVDDQPVIQVNNALYPSGMAGLMAGGNAKNLCTPYFDNVIIKGVNAPNPSPTPSSLGQRPIYTK